MYDYSYGYDNIYEAVDRNTPNEAVAAVFFTIYLIVFTVIVIFALVSYVFHSVGLYTIGKRLGKQYPWLAFVPFARDYFHGELAGEIKLKNKTIKNPGIWNLILPIAGSVLAGIFIGLAFFVGIIIAIAEGGAAGVGIAVILILLTYIFSLLAVAVVGAVRAVLLVLIDRQILDRFTTDNMALVHSVAARFVPLYEAFCFFVMRDKEFREGSAPVPTPSPAPVPPMHPHEAPMADMPPVHPEEASAEFAPSDSTTDTEKAE